MSRNRKSAKRAGEYLTDSEFIKRFWCKTDRSVGERNCETNQMYDTIEESFNE